jgi:hypothetical protein
MKYPGGKLKIAILSSADVAGWYSAKLMQRGHQTMFVDGHPPSAVDQMILEGVEGILILSNGDEMYDEIESRFTRATGRPVWRNLTDIPR